MTDIMTGGPDRDRQLLNYCTTIENLGRVGIPILGHHFMPTGVWRTDLSYPGRGGALVSAFDAARLSTGNALAAGGGDVAITEEELWANYEIFLRTTLPVAERAGVRLALHPDDPPVRTIGPTARLFYSVENLRRAYELSDGSHAWGLDLCLGTVSEMAGGAEAVREAVEIFGPAQAICYIHLRQVIGTVPRFAECFLGEGSYSPREIVSLLADSGFDGFFLDDHVPRVAGDSPWGHRSHAYALGYIQALLSEFESPR